MMQRKNRLLALLLAAALCAAMLPLPASAADSGVTAWTDKIGNGTARLVTVAMQPGRTGEISLANNSVMAAVSAKTLIDQKNNQADTKVVAAINGGFFDSYSGQPQIMNAVVVNNKLIHTGGKATLGFTADGTPMVDWVELHNVVQLGNGYTVADHYGINTMTSVNDPDAFLLFNEHMTIPVNIPAGSKMVFIKDGRVTNITDGGALTVPKGTDVLVYGSAAAAQYQGWSMFPSVGMSAEMVLTASGTSRDDQWAAVETALVGGPVLVKDGKNVVDDSRNSSYYSDPKQKPDYVAQRSFVGILPTGGLVMGTVSASFRQIATWLVSKGAVEGIAMDGGASSMLYANGSFVTPAGRNLASVLTIVDRGGSGGQPGGGDTTPPGTDIPGADAPDSWAAASVQAAIDLGLVPDSLQSGYKDRITRQDFCLLIYELARKDPNFPSKLNANPEPVFSDVSKQTNEGQIVYLVGQLGIISGTSNGDGTYRFNPSGLFDREQAATILANTIHVVGGVEDTGKQHSYTDRSTFSAWAAKSIDFCSAEGIMQGSGGAFLPKGSFSRQQAIIAVLNVYNTYL